MGLETLIAASWWMILPLIALGSVLHFVYDWSGHNRVVAVLGAVNESYWEHIKIAVWPVALGQLVLFAAGGWRHPSFVPAATVALYSIPVGMIGIVFLYKSITKRNILWLDIAVFAVVIVLAQTIFVALLTQLRADAVTLVLSLLYLAGLIASFLLFTLRPPREPDIFVDPLSRKYGLHGHPDGPDTGD